MGTQKFTIAIAAVIVIFLSACTNPRYINSPAVHNATFFRQQGDFKVSAAGSANPISLADNISNEDDEQSHSYGFDGQAAVALTDHFMLLGGGMYRNEEDFYKDDDLNENGGNTKVKYNRNMFDIGAGYFTPMGRGRKNYFNISASVGFGSMSSTDNADPYKVERSRSFKANTMKYSLTPAFNFFFSDYFRMSVSPKFSVLKLSNIKTTYSESDEIVLGYNEARKSTFGLFEPSLLLQAGFRNNDWLKLDLGFNFASDPFTTNRKNSDYGVPVNTKTYNVQSRNFLMSLGISIYPQIRKR